MRTKFSQIVEVAVQVAQASATRIQFQEQPYLRGAKIYGLELFNVNDMALSPNGNELIDDVVMKKGYLTLYTTDPFYTGSDTSPNRGELGAGEYIQYLPLSVLHTLQNANNDPFERWPFEMDGQCIIWEKSYITLASGIGNSTINSFLFNVTFELDLNNRTN